MTIRQLDRSEIRHIVNDMGFRPRSSRGQHFLQDANTIRGMAVASGAHRHDHVLEVGAGLGSLTLALMAKGAQVTTVEVDPALARRLPHTVAEHCHGEIKRLNVLHHDAVTLRRQDVPGEPTMMVVCLPADVVEAALLHLLAEFPAVRGVLLMTGSAMIDRLCAEPGQPRYHPLGVKLRLFGTVHRQQTVSPTASWPMPRSAHGVMVLHRDQCAPRPVDEQSRAQLFDLIDIAFARRRNSSRHAFAEWAGSGNESARRLLTASIDPARRPNDLGIEDFIRLQHRSLNLVE